MILTANPSESLEIINGINNYRAIIGWVYCEKNQGDTIRPSFERDVLSIIKKYAHAHLKVKRTSIDHFELRLDEKS